MAPAVSASCTTSSVEGTSSSTSSGGGLSTSGSFGGAWIGGVGWRVCGIAHRSSRAATLTVLTTYITDSTKNSAPTAART